MLKFSQSR